MPNDVNGQQPKHLKSFWPLFIILIVAAIAALTIYLFANGNILQDQLDSINFWHSRVENPSGKEPAKAQPKTVTTK